MLLFASQEIVDQLELESCGNFLFNIFETWNRRWWLVEVPCRVGDLYCFSDLKLWYLSCYYPFFENAAICIGFIIVFTITLYPSLCGLFSNF